MMIQFLPNSGLILIKYCNKIIIRLIYITAELSAVIFFYLKTCLFYVLNVFYMWGGVHISINKKIAAIACFMPDFRYSILNRFLLLPAVPDVSISISQLCK